MAPVKRRVILFGLYPLLILALLWALFQWREVKLGVIARPVGTCDLEWHDLWGVVVWACPGQGAIKVWPLPIRYNWQEFEITPRERKTVERDIDEVI